MEKETSQKEPVKKVRDLTGNMEERISPKNAEKAGGREGNPRPAMKRPPTRMAGEGQAPEQRQREEGAREKTGARRFERNRKPRDDGGRSDARRDGEQNRPARAEGTREVNPREPEAGQSGQSGRRSRGRGKSEKRRDDRRHDDFRRDDARPDDAEPQKAAKPAQEKRSRGSRADRNGSSAPKDRGVSNARRRRDEIAEAAELQTHPEERPPEEQFTDEQLRADGLLFMLDEPEGEIAPTPAPAEPEEQFEVVGIRFRGAGKVYFFSPNGITFAEGEHAVLETVRGMEYGEVANANRMVNASEVVQPLKPVLRKATAEDDAHYQSNLEREQNARPIFEEKVRKNHLEMQLVDVEYTFDNTKLCFYFTADGRVDFRELVKDLASFFRTRIELRQIGVRDEARMFGGLGVCGRPFCCKSFLSDFAQVSIKMAKEQNLSLASAKISGSCGRLMCCLRYEQDTYERENALLPRPNSIVSTPKGRGVLLESSFLTGNCKVQLSEENAIRVFPLTDIKVLEPPRPKNAQTRNADPAAVAVKDETAAPSEESATETAPPDDSE